MLDKLKNVNVSWLAKLSQDDQIAVEAIKANVLNANNVLGQMLELANGFTSTEWQVKIIEPSDIESQIKKNKAAFPELVYSYFAKKYKLDFEQNIVVNWRNLETYELDAEAVVKDILSQLNGKTFQQLWLEERKRAFVKLLRDWQGNTKYEVKGNSLYFDTRLFYQYISYRAENDAKKGMEAIAALDAHAWRTIKETYGGLTSYISDNEMIDPYEYKEVPNNEDGYIIGFKQFKNGKFQLKFSSKAKLFELLHYFGIE